MRKFLLVVTAVSLSLAIGYASGDLYVSIRNCSAMHQNMGISPLQCVL